MIRRIAVLTGIALLWMSFDFPAQADDLIVKKRRLPCPATPRLPARPSNRSRSAGNRRARSIAINRTRFSSRISFPARATPSANTAAKTRRPAIGTQSSVPARPSIPIDISRCPPTRSSTSTYSRQSGRAPIRSRPFLQNSSGKTREPSPLVKKVAGPKSAPLVCGTDLYRAMRLKLSASLLPRPRCSADAFPASETG
jgi:hypothetical protein